MSSKKTKNIYLLYLWKKIRDMKIRTKLTVYLVMVAVVCSAAIGGTSYVTMRNTLIDTVEDTAISLLKQAGIQMEDRIREFQDASYSFGNAEELRAIYEGTGEESTPWEYSLNKQRLTVSFLMHPVLHDYAKAVILENGDGKIYFYDQDPKNNKMTEEKAGEMTEKFRDCVSNTNPIQWIKEEDRVYFVRKIMNHQGGKRIRTLGTAVFEMDSDFFDLEYDHNPYVSGDNVVIAGEKGDIFQNNLLSLEEKSLSPYLHYKEGNYYVYSARRKLNGLEYQVIPLRTAEFHWNMICFIPYSVILEKAGQVIPRVLFTTFVFLAAGLLLGMVIYRSIKKNLEIIEKGMEQYETGNYSALLTPAVYDEIGCLILQFNHMGLKIDELNQLARKEEEEKQELQYQILEAQINPHFLYNTLGALKWLAYEKGQDEIAKLADAIISLLRFTVKNANQEILLSAELESIKNYLYIQKARYDDAFREEFEVTEEAEHFRILGFLLQPFIENSILHGLDTARNDGVIRITGRVRENTLILSVEDNGKGMTEEERNRLLEKIRQNRTEKYKGFNGIGIINIILRQKLVYGEGFRYEIDSEPGKGTRITLMIPERERTEHEEACIDRRR